MISWSSLGHYGGADALSAFILSAAKAVEMSVALETLRLRGTIWNIQLQDFSALRTACEANGVELMVQPHASWPDEINHTRGLCLSSLPEVSGSELPLAIGAMVELPPSILLLVLREAYYLRKADSSSEHQPNRSLLRSCALVNSAWQSVAQSLLFKSVVCNPRFVRTFLVRKIDGHGSKVTLLQHVRIIDFSIPVHHVDPKALDEFGKFVGLALERCPSLYEIILRGGGGNAFSDELLPSIRERVTSKGSPSSLRSLRIYWRDPRTTFPYRLASYFPSLQFLSISIYGDDEYNHYFGPQPPSDALAGLSLFELRLSGTPPSAVAMLRQVPSTLQVLELPSPMGPFAASAVMEDLQPHYQNLRSLRLKRLSHRDQALIGLCSNLEELMVFVDSRTFELPEVLQPSLKHLLLMISWSSCWGRDGENRADYLSDFIVLVAETVKDSSLHSIRLRGTTWIISPEDLSYLRRECKIKGVDLTVQPHASWPDEMCVKTPQFPRQRSFSHFSLMDP
ncbi:hypothetical protein NMY22_g7884 [Coprinellus aureogranulatus]|nr:hypothetical protein NMY22_g7884 [Coprinellus aureogranulatus]